MKGSRFTAWLAGWVLAAGVAAAQGAPVHNADTYNQIASMEFKQWGFSPKDDYFSTIKKKVLFITLKLPGQGYHDDGWYGTGTILPLSTSYASYTAGVILTGELERLTKPDHYVDEKWRLKSPLRASAYGEASIQRGYIAKEKDYWQTIRNRDLLTIADRSGLFAEGLSLSAIDVTENDRNRASGEILDAVDYLGSGEVSDNINDDFRRIQADISAIRGAHLDDARKSVELHKANLRLEDLAKVAGQFAVSKLLCDSVLYKDGWPKRPDDLPAGGDGNAVLPDNFADGLRILLSLIDLNKL